MFRLAYFIAAFALTSSFAFAQSPPLDELAPTGKLRVGIAIAPTGSAFWATKDAATGKPRGVTIDLGAALAKKLGVPVEYVVFANSGEIVSAANDGKWDVTFVPVDDTRKKIVDFSPAYQTFERAFLVRAGSPIQTIAEVDRPGVRVIGVDNTTTARSASEFLKNTKVQTVKTVEELQEQIRGGKADAVALSRESLTGFAAARAGFARAARRVLGRLHRARRAEGSRCGARLCHRVHRGRQGVGTRASRARRCGIEVVAGGATRGPLVIPPSPAGEEGMRKRAGWARRVALQRAPPTLILAALGSSPCRGGMEELQLQISRNTVTVASDKIGWIAVHSGTERLISKPGGWRRERGRPALAEVFGSIATRQSGTVFKRLISFMGPGYLVAVGYMDPGNWATALAGGSKFGYALLPTAILSSLMAMLLQALCARLGVASGRDLAQACRDAYPNWLAKPLWVLAELRDLRHRSRRSHRHRNRAETFVWHSARDRRADHRLRCLSRAVDAASRLSLGRNLSSWRCCW